MGFGLSVADRWQLRRLPVRVRGRLARQRHESFHLQDFTRLVGFQPRGHSFCVEGVWDYCQRHVLPARWVSETAGMWLCDDCRWLWHLFGGAFRYRTERWDTGRSDQSGRMVRDLNVRTSTLSIKNTLFCCCCFFFFYSTSFYVMLVFFCLRDLGLNCIFLKIPSTSYFVSYFLQSFF